MKELDMDYADETVVGICALVGPSIYATDINMRCIALQKYAIKKTTNQAEKENRVIRDQDYGLRG